MTTKTPSWHPQMTAEHLNSRSAGHLPGLAGGEMLEVSRGAVRSRMTVREEVMAPNGFLHAASIVTLADTSCGYGCVAHLPEGAKGFTTIELKSNHLGTALEGSLDCHARPVHLGRTTQVWDATVSAKGKTLALFRCTQMVLWPKA